MANGRSVAARVGALEGRVEKFEKELAKMLEPHFRAQAELFDSRFAEGFRDQAELIDRLFILRFDEWDKRWDAKLEQKLEQKLDQKFEAKLQPLRDELATVREGIKTLLARRR